jgi:hypothetical protein
MPPQVLAPSLRDARDGVEIAVGVLQVLAVLPGARRDQDVGGGHGDAGGAAPPRQVARVVPCGGVDRQVRNQPLELP